ncbi:MAG: YkgJ family cysteine cluster protein [Bacteroidales bacterium]|nr:YkgJ family cysteine cluster protein [Lachnoclostridium sp.]MCM1383734.1 YkgJ family cysteine cluster protein [Lachnoclostridium sp.]MCM1464362.1 YkgJ family cysteine cluster protein [Bacteroidales bacterium]
MKRYVDMAEISDGRLYKAGDMVKAGCNDCQGCSKCCHDMVNTIILFPLDSYHLQKGLGKAFAEMIDREVELNVVDGVVLPNLKMTEKGNCCAFLNASGRCGIHAFRPDLCRLFPLGRYYENGDFSYFLQVGQCERPHTKVKVSKWIDTPNPVKNKEYLLRWHNLLGMAQELLQNNGNEELSKNLSLAVLNVFYLKPYDVTEDFYPQFAERAEGMEQILRGES